MTRPTRTTRPIPWRLPIALVAIVALALATMTLAGCGAKPAPTSAQTEASSTPAATFPVTITDDAKKSVTVKAEPQRIVSLAPGNTEILYALGLGDRVAGVTTYDDYPAEVKDKPKVGDFTTPNIEAIAAAKPDLILATAGVQADVLAKLEALGAPVVAVDPTSLESLYTDIANVGAITGQPAKATEVVDGMKTKVAEVQAKVAGQTQPTVFVEIGQNPLYTVGSGTLLDDLIKQAGGSNVVAQPGYVAYSLEQLVKANPEVYLASKGSMSNPSDLAKRPGFQGLAAVKTARVYVLDDNLTTRPGPRAVLGLEQIAKDLYPSAFGQ